MEKSVEVQFYLPGKDHELEDIVSDFSRNILGQQNSLTEITSIEGVQRDLLTAGIAWKVLVALSVIETNIQLAERIARSKKIKSFLNKINEHGKQVYIRIGESELINLLDVDVDTIIDLL